MSERRDAIMEAGLAVLQEHGFVGLTQPRVAARAGLRQSALTYYFPTRRDLLLALAQAAIQRQAAAVGTLLAGASPEEAAERLGGLLVRKENTRVLLALVQGAEEEPELRDMVRAFVAGMRAKGVALLGEAGGNAPPNAAYLLHALSVGLAVVNLATDEQDGGERIATGFQTMLRLLSSQSPP